jgi:DNA-binding response OmpR family regulator
MHVSALRRKMRKAIPEARRFIISVRGQGYMVG